tara:strand:+ start:154 stop:525 length:372 start_codon:yes stop_codon:yes gene_type:complete
MKLHHTKYTKNYQDYILSTITEDYNGDPIKTDEEKINFLFHRFYNEYGWLIKRVGKQKAMSEWLSGLAINIPCYNHEIIELAIKMGSVDKDPTEKQKDQIVNNYFNFMANVILKIEDKIKEVK